MEEEIAVQDRSLTSDGPERPMDQYDMPMKGPNRRKLRLEEYPIRIQFKSVGCLIEVGCKEFAFSSIDEAMSELNEYVKNPSGQYEKWMNIINKND